MSQWPKYATIKNQKLKKIIPCILTITKQFNLSKHTNTTLDDKNISDLKKLPLSLNLALKTLLSKKCAVYFI